MSDLLDLASQYMYEGYDQTEDEQLEVEAEELDVEEPADGEEIELDFEDEGELGDEEMDMVSTEVAIRAIELALEEEFEGSPEEALDAAKAELGDEEGDAEELELGDEEGDEEVDEATEEPELEEAVGGKGREVKEYQTYKAWKSAVKKLEPKAKFSGDKEIDSVTGSYDNFDEAEWDGETGVIEILVTDAKNESVNPYMAVANRYL